MESCRTGRYLNSPTISINSANVLLYFGRYLTLGSYWAAADIETQEKLSNNVRNRQSWEQLPRAETIAFSSNYGVRSTDYYALATGKNPSTAKRATAFIIGTTMGPSKVGQQVKDRYAMIGSRKTYLVLNSTQQCLR